MKKLLLTAALVAIFGAANAQFEQGGFLVGGATNLSFSSLSIDGADDNLNTFNLSTRGGYFFADNLAAGLNIGYTNLKQGDDKATTTAIGPFVRYYVGGSFYAGLGYDFTSSKFDDDDSVSGSQLKLEAGYPIFIGGETVALEPALNYWIGGGDLNEDTSTFALTVGFFAYF